MKVSLHNSCLATVLTLLASACAVSPEVEERRLATETSIAEILSHPADDGTVAEPRRCLSSTDFRSYRALNDQYILFTGRGDRHWINTLRNRCFDLDRGDMLITRSLSANRICDHDSFEAADWFSWPWYRRWPWHWGSQVGTGAACMLGVFQPVTEEQVREIEAVLKDQ